jgi:DNA invertase Pin-like site-specific DNA recombinase
VKIKSMDETEGWTQFPELEPDDHLAFQPQMVSMAAWVAEGEREVARRRTRVGLTAAGARGKTLGRRRSLTGD